MSTPESDLSEYLSPSVYHQLQAYRQHQGHPTLKAALEEILQAFFAEPGPSEPTLDSVALHQQLEGLENRVYTLTREMMLLRQSVPDQCDRLREQLAAVRLSHSGLLQNLRQRLEVLESRANATDDLALMESEPTLSGLNLNSLPPP
jgi:hypothetical protein